MGGEGRLFNMDVMDATSEIRVTGFNEQVDAIFETSFMDELKVVRDATGSGHAEHSRTGSWQTPHQHLSQCSRSHPGESANLPAGRGGRAAGVRLLPWPRPLCPASCAPGS